MEDYSAIKRNEVQIHVTIGVSLINIMLSERSQTQKTTCVCVKCPEGVNP